MHPVENRNLDGPLQEALTAFGRAPSFEDGVLALIAKIITLGTVGFVAYVCSSRKALNSSDEVSRPEIDAYTSLARQHRGIVDRLRAVAAEMASYRDLPMANHDMEVLTSDEGTDALREMIRTEEDLLALLRQWTKEYRTMLGEEAGG